MLQRFPPARLGGGRERDASVCLMAKSALGSVRNQYEMYEMDLYRAGAAPCVISADAQGLELSSNFGRKALDLCVYRGLKVWSCGSVGIPKMLTLHHQSSP